LVNTLPETPHPIINDASKQHIPLHFGEQRVKANSAIFIGRNAGSASDFYYQKGRFIISAGQSVIIGIAVGMNRASVINMEFRRDEKGRPWWSVCEIGAMKGAGGASCQGWQLCAAWNKCSTAAAPRDLIKKVEQKCVCPFAVFCCVMWVGLKLMPTNSTSGCSAAIRHRFRPWPQPSPSRSGTVRGSSQRCSQGRCCSRGSRSSGVSLWGVTLKFGCSRK